MIALPIALPKGRLLGPVIDHLAAAGFRTVPDKSLERSYSLHFQPVADHLPRCRILDATRPPATVLGLALQALGDF